MSRLPALAGLSALAALLLALPAQAAPVPVDVTVAIVNFANYDAK